MEASRLKRKGPELPFATWLQMLLGGQTSPVALTGLLGLFCIGGFNGSPLTRTVVTLLGRVCSHASQTGWALAFLLSV